MATLTPQSKEIYSNTDYTVIGTLAVDGWAVIFGTGRRGLYSWTGWSPAQSPHRHINTAQQLTIIQQYGDWYTDH